MIDRFDITKVFNRFSSGLDGLGEDFDYAKMVLANFTDRMQESASITELFGSIGKKVGGDLEGLIAGIGGVLSGVPGALATGTGAGGVFASLAGGGAGLALGGPAGAAFGASLANTVVGAIADRDGLNEDIENARTHDGRERPQGAQLTHQETIVYVDTIRNDFQANVSNDLDLDQLWRDFGYRMEREIKGLG